MSACRLNFEPRSDPAPRTGPGIHTEVTQLLLGALAVLTGLLGWLGGIAVAHAAVGVLVVLSDGGDTYGQVARAFTDALGEQFPTRTRGLDSLSADDLRPVPGETLLLVPIGMKATRFVADNLPARVAVLALLVPRQGFEAISWPAGFGKRRLSAVFIDQPLERSLQLIELLDPRLDRVGVVSSNSGTDTAQELLMELAPAAQPVLRAHGQSLRVQAVEGGKGVAEALRRLLPNVDVLLLLPDSLVVNSANVQNVLLTSYRYRVPVVGFSPGLVTAGAVAAVYSTPEQIGRAGAELAAAWNPASGELPAARHASGFDLAVNGRVARSLGLAVPDTRQLRRRLDEAR